MGTTFCITSEVDKTGISNEVAILYVTTLLCPILMSMTEHILR